MLLLFIYCLLIIRIVLFIYLVIQNLLNGAQSLIIVALWLDILDTVLAYLFWFYFILRHLLKWVLLLLLIWLANWIVVLSFDCFFNLVFIITMIFLKFLCYNLIFKLLCASSLLVFRHVPLGYVLFSALIAYKRSNSHMLPDMDFQVWASVILLITAWKLTMELINIRMCPLMITKDPFLPKLWITAWELANKLLISFSLVRCQMIR